MLNVIMSKLEDGYYNGSNDLLPWQFSADDLTPKECLVLIRAWHHIGKVWSFSCNHFECVKCGYNYIVEYELSIYQIEIPENMGLWNISKIGEI